jgi:N-acetylmuramoyl-L-alanine amidase
MKFFIDAGHGGAQTGAVGNGLIEKNVNLVVSLEIKRILESYAQKVFMTRLTDTDVGLLERCNIANRAGADYFVSVHHNAFDGKRAGSEVYHSINGGKGKELAIAVAEEFKTLGRTVKILSRESKVNPGTDELCVIRETDMPAIISEFAYMDSSDYLNMDTSAELLAEASALSVACLKIAGVDLRGTTTTVKHWAQPHYDFLVSRGITIHEARFDDKITRGEVFALLANSYASLYDRRT